VQPTLQGVILFLPHSLLLVAAEEANKILQRLQEAQAEAHTIMHQMQEKQEQLVRVTLEVMALMEEGLLINLVAEAEAAKVRQVRMVCWARLEKAEMVLHRQYRERLQYMQAVEVADIRDSLVPGVLVVLVVLVVVVPELFQLQLQLAQLDLRGPPIEVEEAVVELEVILQVVREELVVPVS